MKLAKQADYKLILYRNKTVSNNAMVKYGPLVLLKNLKTKNNPLPPKLSWYRQGSFTFNRKKNKNCFSKPKQLNHSHIQLPIMLPRTVIAGFAFCKVRI